jgi:hypothetical protein
VIVILTVVRDAIGTQTAFGATVEIERTVFNQATAINKMLDERYDKKRASDLGHSCSAPTDNVLSAKAHQL